MNYDLNFEAEAFEGYGQFEGYEGEFEGFDFEVGGTSIPAPPAEGPVKGITGGRCRSGRGKCWPANGKSRDVIDTDAPWNNQTKRSASNYEAVLDYFNVGNLISPISEQSVARELENERYRPVWNKDKKSWSTWCNIYAHDVTRAMWASIPHWVKGAGGWNEMTANATFDWLADKGRNQGWLSIDAKLCSVIHANARARSIVEQQIASGQYPSPATFLQNVTKRFGKLSISTLAFLKRMLANALEQSKRPWPYTSLSDLLSAAAQKIDGVRHQNLSLLLQPSYIAQKFGNLGLPTIAILKVAGGIGHVAMIRPERGQKLGQVRPKHGKFLPRTAQAGGKNWTNELMTNMETAMLKGQVLFYVHE